MQWLTDDPNREEWHDPGQVWSIIVCLVILAALLLGILFFGGSAHAQEPYPLPEADPQPGVPYVWGFFMGRWWVSYDAGWPQPDMSGLICITKDDGSVSVCYYLLFQFYDSALGRTWYATTVVTCRAGTWLVYYSVLGGMYAEFRQPNNYPIRCIYVPQTRQG